jgi:hypothetical protein
MTAQRTGILLNQAITDARAYAAELNYEAIFTEDPDLVGWFVTDDSDFRTLSGGSVSSFLNLKPSGLPLIQNTAGQRAELVTDTDLGIEVAAMSGTNNDLYSLTGYSFDAAAPWTMFILAKPMDYASGGMLIGAYGGTAATTATIRALESGGGSVAVLRGTYDDATVSGATDDALRNAWHGIILAYDGTSKMVRIEVDDRGPTLSGVATIEPTITTFSVSHSALNADFRWAAAMLWAADLYNAGKALQLAALYDYIRTYNGMSAGGTGL